MEEKNKKIEPQHLFLVSCKCNDSIKWTANKITAIWVILRKIHAWQCVFKAGKLYFLHVFFAMCVFVASKKAHIYVLAHKEGNINFQTKSIRKLILEYFFPSHKWTQLFYVLYFWVSARFVCVFAMSWCIIGCELYALYSLHELTVHISTLDII